MSNSNNENTNSAKKARKKKTRAWLPFATIIAVILVAVAAIGAWLELQDVENATLDICATQQDGYVQLVLDQINLKENRTDEEIINNILSTLDASSNKYWAFSRDQTMLFVKDVAETNKYKGFTAATFYGTPSASEFIESLKTGDVSHAFININDSEFLASGALFNYENKDYKIVLLTNKAALLNNNKYMGATSRLGVILAFVLGISFLLNMFLVHKIDLRSNQIAETNANLEQAYASNKTLSEKLLGQTSYNNKLKLWSPASLDRFIKKIDARRLISTFVELKFKTNEAKQAFLEQSTIVFPDNVVKIDDKATKLILIFLNQDSTQALKSINALITNSIEICEVYSVNSPTKAQTCAVTDNGGAQ
jgi:hypothetical protein